MAGRGRGRGGSGLSLTHEQLQALGVARGDANAAALTPPPLFPKIEAKPLPLPNDAATDYMLIVKDQFIEYLHESPAYVTAKQKSDGVERYSDKYKIALETRQEGTLDCVWANFPTELRPQAKRNRKNARKRKLDDPVEMAKRLQTLENKETLEGDTNNPKTNTNENIVKKEDADDEDLDDEAEQEDEIDDGTDYGNNYFDNGEDYDDEDDNLDDGPVY